MKCGLHSLSSTLAFCALIAQLALPFAHEWQVARQEADHPYAEALAPGAGPRLAESSESRHSHHDEDLCRLCPALSRLRLALTPRGAQAAAVPSFQRSLADAPRALARAVLLGSSSPRAPPAA